jgi:metal-responsive CopG/Arc/MetJ family transcriptional regulator
MEYMNITFPTELKEQLDREVVKEKTRRSTLIQKAVRVYLGLKSRKNREELLREGYIAMQDETKKVMDDFKGLDKESLKYAN